MMIMLIMIMTSNDHGNAEDDEDGTDDCYHNHNGEWMMTDMESWAREGIVG